MKTDELREAYLSFFESKGCVRKPSDLLVPPNDNSVLFTPAGMNQFKEQFLGIGATTFTRATTCQKCIRTGDIENVGRTARHMTFFEMLGNFSFGDYFKKEAIHWAWEFCTKVLGLKSDALSVTVYLDDDEAAGIWQQDIGIPDRRLKRLGEDDNFWPAGAPSQGPDGVCGPCSEIFADIGTEEVEIWNLVFTQFNRVGNPPNNLVPLPKKNIDTGMGLERTAAVLQGVPTVFDIDIFKPIMRAVEEVTNAKYVHESPNAPKLRRIADHTRAATFLLHENVQPSAEMQGYVLRRLIRRALLDAYQMGLREPLLHKIVPAVVEGMKVPYPELASTMKSVTSRLKLEEEQFLGTVERGIRLIGDSLRKLESAKSRTMAGGDAFDLYQTHGFPLEITEELSRERGVSVDRAGFEAARLEHKKTSGKNAFTSEVFAVGPIQEIKAKNPPTEFLGYTQSSTPATIVGIIADGALTSEPVAASDKLMTLVLDRTTFYGKSGGQIGDTGTIVGDGFEFNVEDTLKTDGYFQHVGKVTRGKIRVGQTVTATIDAARREGIMRAHSATHMLHAALHKVLGKEANQAGSNVERDRFTFDFNHSRGMSREDVIEVERLTNEMIMKASPVRADVMSMEEAKKTGAMALFGEKYGDQVRVVTMGDFSREFCGGCHLSNTGQAGMFRIVREESVSAGVRRITALTGLEALQNAREHDRVLGEAAGLVRSQPAQVPERIEALQNKIRDLEKELKKARTSGSGDLLGRLLDSAQALPEGGFVIANQVPDSSADELRALTDQLRQKKAPLAALLATIRDGKVEMVTSVSQELVDRGMHAGKWIGEVAKLVGGRGGGRPNLAQAGGPDTNAMEPALQQAPALLKP